MPKLTTIGGQEYQIGRLDVFKQLDIARRVMPIYQKLLPQALSRMAEQYKLIPENADEEAASDLRKRITASVLDEYVTIAASELSDDDFHFVVDLSLSVCERIKPGGIAWGVVKPRGGVLQFQDIAANDILALTFQAITENLGSFFPSLAPSLTENQQTGAC